MRWPPRIIDVLLFNDSRKAGIGLWVFYTATALLIAKLILASDWIWATTSAIAVVGGGTIADKFLESRKPPKPPVD